MTRLLVCLFMITLICTESSAQSIPTNPYAHLNKLEVKHFAIDWRHPDCREGYYDKFVLIGKLDSFTTRAVADAFRYNRNGCLAVVELHSGGGTYLAGRDLGNFFRKNNVQTIVPSWAICSSACANAFYGGVHRTIQLGGSIAIHRPYRTIYRSGRDPSYACDREAGHKKYLEKMLGDVVAQRVYQLEGRHCGPDGAYTVNTYEASQIGITR